MGSVEEIQQVCRLCLVKDQVNIPIFDETSDIRQTFLKISACLPVKLSRDDNLPKKICDGCSYKLDMLYVFRNTSVESEKQLIQWLNQVGLSTPQLAKPEILVKQETFDPPNESGDISDTQNYLLQQQKLPYPQEFAFGEVSEEAAGTADLLPEEEGPSPKRARRAASLKKPPPQPVETDDEDLDAAMQITKAEDEDSEDADQPEYVEAPSTSADDQPGPSGVGKGAVEAPSDDVLKSEELILDTDSENSMFESLDCLYCGKTLSSDSALKDHLLIHTGERPFPCDQCDMQFKTQSDLKLHRESHSAEKLSCDRCGKSVSNSRALWQHQKRCEESFECTSCDEIFENKRQLRAHKKRNHGFQNVTCDICKKQFSHKHLLNKHIRRKHNPQQFLCNICGKVFTTSACLSAHMNNHLGDKPYKCEYCDKAFTAKKYMRLHVRTHTGEKPFACEYCGKTFSQRTPLSVHVRAIHTGEKPYSCHICPKKCVSRGLLNAHLKSH